jgi:FkbM family methyltransferase
MSAAVQTMTRLVTWLASPAAHKRTSLRYHLRRAWLRVIPGVPVLLRCQPGLWWIAREDGVSEELFTGTFELNERRFVERFVKPGMIVLDVGAHAGYYTLLTSKLVGRSGRVFAFEPSPRERQRLLQHLRLNRCRNVTVERVALSDRRGDGELFVFDRATGCNSFHPGDTRGAHRVTVPVTTLDELFAAGVFTTVDVVKMDIEGAELSALRGAERIFRDVRPALLCEVHDKRTAPWGYRARDIIDVVAAWGYRWYSIEDRGSVSPISPDATTFFGNAVALPVERPWP